MISCRVSLVSMSLLRAGRVVGDTHADTQSVESTSLVGYSGILRWSSTQRVNFFRKELCRKRLPSLYRDSRRGFKMSLFWSHLVTVND